MESWIEERDEIGGSLEFIEDTLERSVLIERLREIEYDLYWGYRIYPIYTGFGWRPPTPRLYRRQLRVPVRHSFVPALETIPEDFPLK
jgi:hypothetical protein